MPWEAPPACWRRCRSTRLTYETSDFNSFASITVSFRFGPLVMGVALLMTLVMGLFGGMLPAVRAVRLDVISALREL